MKISKAMKHIARLKGKISDLTQRMSECTSINEENDFIEDFYQLRNDRNKAIVELIEYKDAVMKANIKYNKFITILELAEIKNEIELYKNLFIKQGVTKEGYNGTTINYKSQITISEKNDKINELQEHINDLTDELDIFNATTDIIID